MHIYEYLWSTWFDQQVKYNTTLQDWSASTYHSGVPFLKSEVRSNKSALDLMRTRLEKLTSYLHFDPYMGHVTMHNVHAFNHFRY